MEHRYRVWFKQLSGCSCAPGLEVFAALMSSVSFILSLGLGLIETHEELLVSLDLGSLSLVKEAGVISISIILPIKTFCQRIMDINWSIYPNSYR